MPEPVSTSEYARSRRVNCSVVRRWIRDRGAPVVSRGGPGPGNGSLVDPDKLDIWRGLDDGMRMFLLGQVAEGLLDALVRDGPEGVPVHRSIGIDRRRAAAMLAFGFQRASRRVLGRDLEDWPPEIVRVCTIAENG